MTNQNNLNKDFVINVITNVIKEVNGVAELLAKNEHFSGGFKLSTLQKELIHFLEDLKKTEPQVETEKPAAVVITG